MDMEQIGYYLFMEEMEQKHKEANVECKLHLVEEEAATNEEEEAYSISSRNVAPTMFNGGRCPWNS